MHFLRLQERAKSDDVSLSLNGFPDHVDIGCAMTVQKACKPIAVQIVTFTPSASEELQLRQHMISVLVAVSSFIAAALLCADSVTQATDYNDSAAANPKEVLFADIVEIMKARQNAITSIKASWKRNVAYGADRLAVSPGASTAADLLNHQHTVTDVDELCWIQGEWLRCSTSALSAINAPIGVVNQFAFNGKVYQDFIPNPNGAGQGMLRDGDAHPMRFYKSSLSLLPLLFAIRPLGEFALDVKEVRYRVRPGREDVGGVECVVIEEVETGRPVRRIVWLDPSRDYSVIRCTDIVGPATTIEVSLEYETPDEKLWLPVGWTTQAYARDGTVLESAESHGARYSVNVPMTEDDFTLTFPAGTRVIDERGGVEKQFVVNTDGTWSDESRRAAPIGHKRERKTVSIVLLANVVLIGAVVFILYRRRIRRG